MNEPTPEQDAREMLERMGVEDAQSWSGGELAELANLIAEVRRLRSLWTAEDLRLIEQTAHGAEVLAHQQRSRLEGSPAFENVPESVEVRAREVQQGYEAAALHWRDLAARLRSVRGEL